ncbi:MAG: hypothetical protein HY000_17325 [Planctomycetes bacterium]|nr:hypothetical protein [Planctomycetota bacterium]
MATDDRRAIRVAQQAGIDVLSSPTLLKSWAAAAQPDQATIVSALKNIELFAQFRPTPSTPDYRWWIRQLKKHGK